MLDELQLDNVSVHHERVEESYHTYERIRLKKTLHFLHMYIEFIPLLIESVVALPLLCYVQRTCHIGRATSIADDTSSKYYTNITFTDTNDSILL